ncbi:ovostatin-like isoform X2 [Mixophyes fleayi]|uniref:ovostatin-like isoform X2 n=1 Tax=Mixophyes fleayi TaxID=3061075 RepID=UPI003F4DD329
MGLRNLLLSVSILCLITAGYSELEYVLVTPAMLPGGDTGRVLVDIRNITEPLDLILVLEHNGKNTMIVEQNIAPPKYFEFHDYLIPEVPSSVPAALILSATGKGTDLRDRKAVVIKPSSNSCVFQMDKPIYKAGQKVQSRIVCLTAQLKAFNQKFKSVYLQDPSGAKMAQWLNKETVRGVVSMEFQLISDANPGSYVITAERESSYPISQWFTVEEYVLPRFEVNVEAPNTVSVRSKTLTFNVSAIYTFGEPVAGSITVRYCKQPEFYGRRQNGFPNKGGFCANMTGELGSEGTYSGVINMLTPTMRTGGRGTSINVDIIVTEAGTGIQVTKKRYVYITSQPASLQLDYESVNQYYKRGLNYPFVVTLKDKSSQPIPNQEIELALDGRTIQTLITDSDGKVEYEIDTYHMVKENFTLKASYKNPDQGFYAERRDHHHHHHHHHHADYPYVEYTVYRFYSKYGSFLQMKRPKGELSCGKSHSIDVQYIVTPAGVGEGATKATFNYVILSRSKITQNGQIEVDLPSTMNGSFCFDVHVSSDLAPNADMVVYTILQKEFIADTTNLNIEKCFKNTVAMTFSGEKGVPGSDVEVQVAADPASICGLRVIDNSLLLLNSFEPFSPDGIYDSIGTWHSRNNIDGFTLGGPEPPCEDPNKIVFNNGEYYKPVSSRSEGDTYQKLMALGLMVSTDATLRKPVVCGDNPPPEFAVPLAGLAKAPPGEAINRLAFDGAGGSSSTIKTVRKNFAETFLWTFLTLNAEGQNSVSEKVPDTITKWQGTAFCLSDEGGFGMTKCPANFTTYLPFIEMSLPYSIIRGETFVLVAIVRNYLEQCVKVQVTLENSDAFNAVQKEGEQDACICPNKRATYKWEVDVNKIGKIEFTASAQTTHIGESCDGPNDSTQSPRKDTVVQSLIAELEGIRKELTLSNLVLVQNKSTEIPLTITPPDNVVPDSVSAYVTAIGDVFGLSLQNLQDLVQKPYGCAEHNLARMAPIPYVVAYLNNTGQLTDELLQKAKGYMSEGYYRQLSYSYGGGEYNLFSNSREQGNSMLTAYTFKTFESCKPYIFIDETRQQQTLIRMESSQRLDNGCFKAKGNVIAMQDTDIDLYYTAYLSIALLESNCRLSLTLLGGCMECLKNASKTEQTIFVQVLMLYSFTLADLPEYRGPLLEKLMKKAIVADGTMHWEREEMPKRPCFPFFRPPFASNEVLITSYMLLSLAAMPDPSNEDLATMAKIAVWLGSQLNSHGGSTSTQDTVLALQAMAAFGKMLYTPDSHQTVVVKKGNGEIASFDLNKNNRLLVQRQQLPDATGDYSIDVNGLGWCLIQTTVVYYIPIPKENSAFSLDITTSSASCVNGVAYAFTIDVHLSYKGVKNASNMAVVQIRMLSGYTANDVSLSDMVNKQLISKFEVNPKKGVIIYLDSVSSETVKFSFQVLMGPQVQNMKTASGYVYSHYEDDENGYASYNHPCTEAQ